MGLLGPTRTTKEKSRLNRLASENMRPGYIRLPLFVLLGLALFYGYTWNFERKFSEIEAKSSFLDQTGIWSQEDRLTLYRKAKIFKNVWGMKVLVHVRTDDIPKPVSVGNTIFIGVNPSRGESMLVLPVLASRALEGESLTSGGDVRELLERNLGLCAQLKPNSAPCVMEVLDALNAIFEGQ